MGPGGVASVHSTLANTLSHHYAPGNGSTFPYPQEVYHLLKETQMNPEDHIDMGGFNAYMRWQGRVRGGSIHPGTGGQESKSSSQKG